MRRMLMLLALVPVLALGDQMVNPPANRFQCSLNSLAATLTECQAAVAGRTYFITDITVQTTTGTSGAYAIQSGTGTNCATGTAPVFPVRNVADRFNAPILSQAAASFQFATPLSVAAGNAICVIGTLTNTISIQIGGYYRT